MPPQALLSTRGRSTWDDATGHRSGEDEPGRLEPPAERVQDEAQDLEGDGSEERLVTRFAEDDRRVAFALRQRDVAFGDVALDLRAAGQNEGHASLVRQAGRAPACRRQKAVLRPAVDHESHRARTPGEAAAPALPPAQSHPTAPRTPH